MSIKEELDKLNRKIDSRLVVLKDIIDGNTDASDFNNFLWDEGFSMAKYTKIRKAYFRSIGKEPRKRLLNLKQLEEEIALEIAAQREITYLLTMRLWFEMIEIGGWGGSFVEEVEEQSKYRNTNSGEKLKQSRIKLLTMLGHATNDPSKLDRTKVSKEVCEYIKYMYSVMYELCRM